jgi:predicted HicB family RNase H-like nuclease
MVKEEKMTTHITLRLPPDAKAFIAAQAERNTSSQNSEIIRCIRDRMDRETKTATEQGCNPT